MDPRLRKPQHRAPAHTPRCTSSEDEPRHIAKSSARWPRGDQTPVSHPLLLPSPSAKPKEARKQRAQDSLGKAQLKALRGPVSLLGLQVHRLHSRGYTPRSFGGLGVNRRSGNMGGPGVPGNGCFLRSHPLRPPHSHGHTQNLIWGRLPLPPAEHLSQ